MKFHCSAVQKMCWIYRNNNCQYTFKISSFISSNIRVNRKKHFLIEWRPFDLNSGHFKLVSPIVWVKCNVLNAQHSISGLLVKHLTQVFVRLKSDWKTKSKVVKETYVYYSYHGRFASASHTVWRGSRLNICLTKEYMRLSKVYSILSTPLISLW